ncbi:hypothetical protein HYZ78_04325 [Candidatus Microgenomates bacterium]|nr:hypothetical protein [Candidatus Microgenomates bacterium]
MEKIVEIKISNVEDEFRVSNIHIDLQVSPRVVEWLTDRGYNPAEGARALSKVIDTYIKDPLIMVASDINQRTVIIDMEEYDSEPKFYYIAPSF